MENTLTAAQLDTLATGMDDDIREEVHARMAPCEPAAFLDAYLAAHRERHGAEWVRPGDTSPFRLATYLRDEGTAAERIARDLGDDGLSGLDRIPDLCRGADVESSAKRGAIAYTFADGSGIVVAGNAWDIKHPDCTCGFCWTGAELLCGTGDE